MLCICHGWSIFLQSRGQYLIKISKSWKTKSWNKCSQSSKDTDIRTSFWEKPILGSVEAFVNLDRSCLKKSQKYNM